MTTSRIAAQPLFVPVAAQAAGASSAVRDQQVTRWQTVKVDRGLLTNAAQAAGASAAPSQAITLNLFDDVKFIARADRVERTERGVTWSGKLQGLPNSQVTLIVNDDVVSGNITTPKERYHIRFAGNGIHEVQQIDQTKFKND